MVTLLMVGLKKCWSVWCKLNQWKKSNRIYSRSWSRYPEELMYNTLAPEKPAISYDMLSDYCQKIAD